MISEAVLSEDMQYRYVLSRIWNTQLPIVLFAMLNPSTADASINDATIRRCIGFAKLWGFGGIVVVNLYAIRATDPHEVFRHLDFIGPENDAHIKAQAKKPARVVCAWGNHAHRDRADAVCRLLLAEREGLHLPNQLYCLGKTGSGAPHHPVRLPYTTQLEVYC